MKKSCVVCSSLFDSRQSRQIRCVSCQSKHRNSHERLKYNKICIDCNQGFKTGNMRAPRCMTCRYNTKCQSCDTEFYREVSTQRFCSRKCSDRSKKDFYYNGTYSEVMARDGNECRKCGSTGKLSVHHIDHSGSHKVKTFEANNDIENLVVLCDKCHRDIHTLTYKTLAEKHTEEVVSIANQFLSGA